jgi:uncharacterized protein with von Willebrand factor type A (vWA) domain
VVDESALLGLFRYLVGRGFPLSVRDYEDALRALQCGYGLNHRDNLRWLCEQLWARTEDEVRHLHRVFEEFAGPPSDVAAARPSSAPTVASQERGDEQKRSRGQRRPPVVTTEFVASRESGSRLPAAPGRIEAHEPFIFTPRPVISLRSLIIAWRRYRMPLRAGPPVELDIEATVEAQSRSGALTEPVRIPARRNLARLLIVFDTSPSMAAWASLIPLVTTSLGEGRLGFATMYYCDNVPRNVLYATPRLTAPRRLQDVLNEQPSCSLLMVSDAGAARGRNNGERVTQMRSFLTQVHTAWKPVAWANPMPRERWRGTSAERISRIPGVHMVELTEDGLIAAVDILRGRAAG